RCKVEQLQLIIANSLFDPSGLIARGMAIERSGRNAKLIQLEDLILHQRDERRDHNSQALKGERRKLVTKGFARARCHHYRNIAPRQNTLNDLLLILAELLKAKVPLEK